MKNNLSDFMPKLYTLIHDCDLSDGEIVQFSMALIMRVCSFQDDPETAYSDICKSMDDSKEKFVEITNGVKMMESMLNSFGNKEKSDKIDS